jgi:hypothetical protein
MPLFSLVELVCLLLFLGHVSGCFFYFFSTSFWYTAAESQLVDMGVLSTWIIQQFGSEIMVKLPQK